jgi:hypothetical protein
MLICSPAVGTSFDFLSSQQLAWILRHTGNIVNHISICGEISYSLIYVNETHRVLFCAILTKHYVVLFLIALEPRATASSLEPM